MACGVLGMVQTQQGLAEYLVNIKIPAVVGQVRGESLIRFILEQLLLF